MPELDSTTDTDTNAETAATELFPHEAMLLRGIAELAYQETADNNAAMKSLIEHLDHQFEAIATNGGDEPVTPDADDADPNVALLAKDPWTEHSLAGALVPEMGYQQCIRVPDDLLRAAGDTLISAADKLSGRYYGTGREAEQQIIDERLMPVISDVRPNRD